MLALTIVSILISGLIISAVGMLKQNRKRTYQLKQRPMYVPHGYRGRGK